MGRALRYATCGRYSQDRREGGRGSSWHVMHFPVFTTPLELTLLSLLAFPDADHLR